MMSVEEQVQDEELKQSPTLSNSSSSSFSSEEGYLSSASSDDLVENESGDETSVEGSSSDGSDEEEGEEIVLRPYRTRPAKSSPLCDSASLSQLQALLPMPKIAVSSPPPQQRSPSATSAMSMRQEAVLRSFRQRRQSELEETVPLPRIEIEQVGLDEDSESDCAVEDEDEDGEEGRSRARASRRMLSALGRGRPGMRRQQSLADRRGGGHARVPSLDQISTRVAALQTETETPSPASYVSRGTMALQSPTPGTPGSAFSMSPTPTPTHARSFSCPHSSSAAATFGKVKVFVTPPTPRPQLPSSPSTPSSMSFKSSEPNEGHGLLLTPPPVEMAPGRNKQLQESQEQQQQHMWTTMVSQFWTNAAILGNASVAAAAAAAQINATTPWPQQQQVLMTPPTELHIPRRQPSKRKTAGPPGKKDEGDKAAVSGAAESSSWWRRPDAPQPRQPSTSFRPITSAVNAKETRTSSYPQKPKEDTAKEVKKYVPPAKRGSFGSATTSSPSPAGFNGLGKRASLPAKPAVPMPAPTDRARVAQTMLTRLGQRQGQTAGA
ncbi:hypothetical protein FA10DRAFT_174817 [Acaromyces ingoldii]|uniref:Uncharacterized protein n=1 Tax=Acaromyces ingoldii TaxID=215250 RepID=A0A316YF41_9BASI|nr:hypothetical protein FA10DRAFT_174817 [Acaromyces ingoldii]PWN87696.1 hypothetical protein FA10DRAFT_174817 [Acaromyces ingoldii]